MFRVIKDQLRSLGLIATQNFVEEMVEHLNEFTPAHAKSLGSKALQEVVQLGVQRAGKYGFTQRGPVHLYIELMAIFGSEFDTDPQYEWASTTLTRPWGSERQLRRANVLYLEANDYLDAAFGSKNKYAIAALRRTLSEGLDFVPHSSENINQQILRNLRHIAPEKCSIVGSERLELLIRHGLSAAQAHGAQTAVAQSLVVLLMFELGHGCLTDPQFPWIRLTLAQEVLHDKRDIFQELRRKSHLYLEHILNDTVNRCSQ